MVTPYTASNYYNSQCYLWYIVNAIVRTIVYNHSNNIGSLMVQCEAPKITKLVYNSNVTMVNGTYNELVTGAYKPTYNWGAPHCNHSLPILSAVLRQFSQLPLCPSQRCHRGVRLFHPSPRGEAAQPRDERVAVTDTEGLGAFPVNKQFAIEHGHLVHWFT